MANKAHEFIAALKEKGYKVEESDGRFGYAPTIGIYHWFDYYGTGTIIAEQRFSMNTGRATRAHHQRMKMYRTIERITGLQVHDYDNEF